MAAIVMIPLAFLIGQDWVEVTLLAGTVLLVLMVELLNTGIESCIDRIGPEWHDLSKRAKDMGSAAVLLALLPQDVAARARHHADRDDLVAVRSERLVEPLHVSCRKRPGWRRPASRCRPRYRSRRRRRRGQSRCPTARCSRCSA